MFQHLVNKNCDLIERLDKVVTVKRVGVMSSDDFDDHDYDDGVDESAGKKKCI